MTTEIEPTLKAGAPPTTAAPDATVTYPESDGLPMADNTLQFRWIVVIKENLDTLFRDDPNVFVAGDLFWYPLEGDNHYVKAPDIMVVFGRPKGNRGSYRQWEEDNLPPHVVFEVQSPGNSFRDLLEKLEFYDANGVEEYYLYNPHTNDLTGFVRRDNALHPLAPDTLAGWVSPRLGIVFDLSGPELRLLRPDGQPFLTHQELSDLYEQAEQQAQQERQQRQQAEQRAQQAEQRAVQFAEERDQERQRSARLVAHLRDLGIDPETL